MSMTISGSGTITGITAGGLPDATITQAELATGVAGTGPAFSAYNSSNTSMTQNTWTKIAFQTEEFDTNSAFDHTTNYRFQPLVAGYYQFNAAIVMSTTQAVLYISFYKNGSPFKNAPNAPSGSGGSGVSGSALIYLNGSTDYVEMYSFQSAATQNAQTGERYTYFQASMVRAA